MKTIQVMIVDDDPAAVKLLADYAIMAGPTSRIEQTTDPVKALQLLRKVDIDILFLDVEMDGIGGLDFFEVLSERTKVVLCSGDKQYAYNGIKLNAIDFLHKPISFADFLHAFKKAEEALFSNSVSHVLNGGYHYFLGKLNAVDCYKLDFKDIVMVESQGNQVMVTLPDGEVKTLRMGLRKITQLLPKDVFMKVHRRFVVSKIFFREFKEHKIGLRHVNNPIPVGGRREAKEFFDWMEEYSA